MKKSVLAPIIFSSALFAAAFSRRVSPAAPPWTPPAPSNLPPPFPSPLPPLGVPAPPWALPPLPPPPPPKMIAVKAGHRYEVVADVQSAEGVSTSSAAKQILDALHLADPERKGYENVDRPGVGEVTRVKLRVTTLVDHSFPLDTLIRIAGVGSIWVVSIKDVKK
jgi:hypothetical protein